MNSETALNSVSQLTTTCTSFTSARAPEHHWGSDFGSTPDLSEVTLKAVHSVHPTTASHKPAVPHQVQGDRCFFQALEVIHQMQTYLYKHRPHTRGKSQQTATEFM